MKNKRLDHWERKESNSVRKKSKVLSLVILFVAALLMIFVFQFSNILEGGITGAVTGLEILPSEENIDLNLTINDTTQVVYENITLNETNISLTETDVVLNETNTTILEPIVEEVSTPGSYGVQDYNILVEADPTTCGTVNSNLVLAADIVATGTCFTIQASNIILDGNGHTITGAGSIGVYIENAFTTANVTIKNFARINNFTYAIILYDTSNSTVYNNTITGNRSGGYGIWVYPILYSYGNNTNNNLSFNIISLEANDSEGIYTNASNTIIQDNNITNYGTALVAEGFGSGVPKTHGGSDGIYVESPGNQIKNNRVGIHGEGDGISLNIASNNTLQDNNVTAYGNFSWGINLFNASNNTIRRNLIYGYNTNATGIYLDYSRNNTIDSSNITTNSSGAYGIFLDHNVTGTTLLNNNISATADYEIKDATGDSYLNYLVYNNSFGEMRWINETNNGFLKNMTLNGTLVRDISLFIGNNTIALNTSAFSIGRINTSANITIFGLSSDSVIVIKKVDNFTTSSNDVVTHGTNCISTSCTKISYDSSTGILLFNVTSFSSFAADISPTVTTPVIHPTTAYTNSTLNASTNYTASGGQVGTVYFKWFVDGVNVYNTTNTSVTSRTNATTTLHPNNFSHFNLVNVTVYANDGTYNSATNMSSITISDLVPETSNVVLNATDNPTNNTNANLTLYWSVSDGDEAGDNITNITDWRINLTSIALVNIPFENNSYDLSGSNGVMMDYSTFSNNATGTVKFNSTASRNRSGAVEFVDDSKFDLVSAKSGQTNFNWTDAFTVSVWINMTIGSKTTMEDLIMVNGAPGWFITVNQSRPNFLLKNDTDGIDCQSGTRINDSTWHYLTYINNASGRTIFIDGRLDTSCTDGPYRFGSATPTAPRIGLGQGGVNAFTGTMDDLIIFNQSLDIKQILILNSSTNNLIDSSLTRTNDTWQACVTSNDRFQDGTQVCSNNLTITADSISPSVNSINTPAARTNFTTGNTIVFNTSVSDGIGVTSVLFQISNGSNPGNVTGSSTNSSLFNASLTVSSTSIVDGNHTLIVFASDAVGNMNGTVNTTFVVDKTAPKVIELYNLTERSNLTKNIPTFSFQVNDSLSPTMMCEIVINSNVNISGVAAGNGTTVNQVATRSMPDGSYNWSINCNDSVRISNVSITNNFTIDTTVPEVSITSPIDRTNFTTGGNVTFAARVQNVSGTAIHIVLFEITNGSSPFNWTSAVLNTTFFNASISFGSAVDPNISDGNHTLIVFANDTAGNVNRSMNVTFVVDTTAPKVVELYNLTERTNLTKNIPTFSFQVNDSLSPTMTCEVRINSNVNISGVAAGNGTTVNQVATRSMPDGSYNWSINCNDSVRISNISITNNFTIDVSNPTVDSINTPATRTNFTTGNTIVFNASVSDGVGVTSVLFQISNGSNPGNVTGSSTNSSLFNASLTVSSTSIVDGNHTLIVFASDAVGNMNGTVNSTFVVDKTAPKVVELYNLTERSNLTKNIPTFSFQVNDSLSPTMTCEVVINSNVNISGVAAGNGTTVNQVATRSMPDGSYNWSINCNDSVRISNVSITNNFTIDTLPPLVSINTPINRQNYTTGGTVVFNTTVSNRSSEGNVTDIFTVLFQLRFANNTLRNATTSSTNATLFNASLAVSIFQDGNHTLFVYANDTTGNENNTFETKDNITFVIDTRAPDTVELYAPDNAACGISPTADTTPQFSWQVNDSLSTTMLCDLIIDGAINTTAIVSANGTTASYNISALSDGCHTWNITCNDSVRISNFSLTRTFTIDASAPSVSTSGASLITSSSAQLQATTNEVATCKYDISDVSYAAMASTMDGAGTSTHSHSVTGLSSGISYTYYVRCQDVAGTGTISSTSISFTTTSSGSGSGGGESSSTAVTASDVSPAVESQGIVLTSGEVKQLFNEGKVKVDVMTAAKITSGSISPESISPESISSGSISATELITFTVINNGDKIVELYPELKEEFVDSESIDEFEDNLKIWSIETEEPLTEEQIELYKLAEQKDVQPIFTEKTFSLANLFKTGEIPSGEISEQISTTPIVTLTEVPIFFVNEGDKVITLKPELKEKEIVLENEAEIESALNLRISEEHPDLTEEEQEKLVQEIKTNIKLTGDVQPILTEKAFSFFESNGGIVHTGQQITGKLLESHLEDCGEVVLNPGESFEKTCTMRRGLTADPTPAKIVFKSEDKEVLEKDVALQEGAVGAVIDVDLENNLIELYMLIPKVDDVSEEFNDYSLEFMINDKVVDINDGDTNLKYLFAELFGPFLVQEDKGFVFAQQFKYNPAVYYGNKLIQTRVIRNGELVAKHEFNVNLGWQEGQMELAISEERMLSILFVFSLLSIVILLLGSIIIIGNQEYDLDGNRKTKSWLFKFIFFTAIILVSGCLLFGLSTEHVVKNNTPDLNQDEISLITNGTNELTEKTELISQTNNLREDTWLSSGVTYTGQRISGKLLKSYLEDCGKLVVNPGEKIENTCTLRKGLSAKSIPRKIVFKSFGDQVLEKDIPSQDSEMGATVDLIKEEKLLELYMLIPAVDGPSEESNNYFLEFTVNDESNSKPLFAEIYGPYLVREDNGFIFAQQLKYDPEIYFGKRQAQIRLSKEDQTIAQQNFTLEFGGEEILSPQRLGELINNRLVLTALFISIFIPAIVILYFIKKRKQFELF